MSATPLPSAHIALEQWRALIAVIEAGGYAQAAERLHKSQSAVTYAVQKIEAQLGVKAFEIQGRKAVLTATGDMLYRRAQGLVQAAGELERAARNLSAGWEAEIGIAAEIVVPSWLLLDCLQRFGEESPQTRIELIESVISGTAEALLNGSAHLAISPRIPPGFFGELLIRMPVLAVAHPEHPLHQLGRPLTQRDFKRHRHITVRDSGSQRDPRAVSIEAEQRWTVSNMATSIEALCLGYGFAWVPHERIRNELATGRLKPLPLKDGGERWVDLYLILADPEFAGPGVRRLAAILRERVTQACATAQACEG